jgi:predicted flap endonuclease-1-like 5' DNA nuclease
VSEGSADRVSKASLLVAALLFCLAPSPAPQPGRAVCPEPREIAQHGLHTVDVACDLESAAPAPLRGPARLLFGQRLDLNRADPAALQALPGIGPARAAAIARARGERPFERPRDLTRVPGIGPRTVAALEGLVEVAGN